MLDKTGTVTEGRMVLDLAYAPDTDLARLPRTVGAIEAASEHPVGRVVASAAATEVGTVPPVGSFAVVPGLGATGVIEGHTVFVGRACLDWSPRPDEIAARCAEWEALGRTTVVVRQDRELCGVLAVAGALRPSSAAAAADLQQLGLRCILASGDNHPTLRAVGAAVGIDEVVAGALPTEKVADIRSLQEEGRSIAMVGDDVNDAAALTAAALTAADLSLAVGSGTDVAIDAGDIVILRSNLVWAFAKQPGRHPDRRPRPPRPAHRRGAMAMSSSFVVWNSARLRRPQR